MVECCCIAPDGRRRSYFSDKKNIQNNYDYSNSQGSSGVIHSMSNIIIGIAVMIYFK